MTMNLNWAASNRRQMAAASDRIPTSRVLPSSRIYFTERAADRSYPLIRVTDTTHVVRAVAAAGSYSSQDSRHVAVSLPRVRFLES
jgi:hypothetical protein